MDLSSAMKKLFYLHLIIFPHASAVTHSVQYLYTALTPGVNLTAVGLLDGEQIVYYDTNIREMIPKTEWMKRISADDPDNWKNQTRKMERDQEKLKQLLVAVMKDVNHTEGVHTLRRRYGCELYNNGTTGGYDQFGYDGEDFISLDLKTGTWTAANDTAEKIREKWDPAGTEANIQKSYLEKECIELLKKFVSYSNVEGKGGLSCGEKAGIVVAVVVILIVAAVLFIICNRYSGHEGYVARTDILELS